MQYNTMQCCSLIHRPRGHALFFISEVDDIHKPISNNLQYRQYWTDVSELTLGWTSQIGPRKASPMNPDSYKIQRHDAELNVASCDLYCLSHVLDKRYLFETAACGIE